MKFVYSCSLILKDIAFCRIQKDLNNDIHYIDSLFVKKPFRRRGIGTDIVMHACYILGDWPDMDIRSISTVAERIAVTLGYEIYSVSERYKACYLWKNDLPFACKEPRFEHLKQIEYRGIKRSNRTLYLSGSISENSYNKALRWTRR